MRLSKADFAAIKAKTAQKRAKRAIRVSDNLALSGQDPLKHAPGCLPCPANAPKARKPSPMSQKLKIKAIKKRCLGSGGTWSVSVRTRDGYRCILCGSLSSPQAHHWYYSRSRSVALSMDISNGATLCYGCHVGKIHREASGAYADELKAKMLSRLPPGELERMAGIFDQPQPLDLAWWQEAEQRLKTFLQNRC